VRTIVLQHVACEPPGVYEDVLRERGAVIERVELDDGEPLPALDGAVLVVVMGGPMGAYDEDDHPWLVAEKQYLARAVVAQVPVFGACLGAQLLADATGGRAYRGRSPEVGVLPVQLTEAGRADPVFGVLPEEFLGLQWHGDTFDLPPGAVLLASSPAYPNQAFRVGRSYAVQFHLEVSTAMAEEWAQVPAYAESLDDVLGPGSAPGLFATYAAAVGAVNAQARALFERLLDQVWPPP
jgi:GMP synthase-like glutamine amidotransferase